MFKRNRTLAWAMNQFRNRSLQSLSYRYDRGFARPTRIIFCVTLRCNIKCKQCSIWSTEKPGELTTDEWKKVIYDLRRWIGPTRVQLAGGETFIRKDITEIIRYATQNDVLTGVVTNGTMITRELAKEIVDSGLGYIHVSMDGINANTHDYIRGIPGVYDKAMASITNLVEASRGSGMSICMATIILKKNMHELVDLVKWVEKNGLDGIIFNPLGPTIDSDPQWYNKTDLWFDDLNEINGVLDELIKLKKSGSKILNPPEQFEAMKRYFEKPYLTMVQRCMVGITNLSITCDGYIHTCFKMPPLGNIREITPEKAWNSQQARSVRKEIKNCDIHCSQFGNFVYRRNILSEVVRFIKYG
ncbi:MAG: radical SAM protein [Thermodesulfobacteriota bacterium]|nr:radical SAM protein [Thermodesulfobacteriota bacterium]